MFNGLLDGTEETDVSNLDTDLYPDFSIPENMQESIFESLDENVDTTTMFKIITSHVLNVRRDMVDYRRSNVRNKFVSCPVRITQRRNRKGRNK